jgi:hypothetical protein
MYINLDRDELKYLVKSATWYHFVHLTRGDHKNRDFVNKLIMKLDGYAKNYISFEEESPRAGKTRSEETRPGTARTGDARPEDPPTDPSME